MAIGTRKPMSRRGLLAAVAGGVAAAAAGTLAGAQRVLAAGSDGEAVVVGGTYDDIRTATTFRRTTGGEVAFRFGPAADGTEVEIENGAVVLHGRSGRFSFVDDEGFRTEGDNAFAKVAPGTIRVSRAGEDASSSTLSAVQLDTPRIAAGRARIPGVAVAADGDIAGVEATGGDIGVIGGANDGRGVRGWGERGGHFSGRSAQVRLQPSKKPNHPNRGKRGDLFVDSSGRLWYCKGGTEWRKLAS